MVQATDVGAKPIVIRISDELHAALRTRAEMEERPVSQVMRRALRRYIEDDGLFDD